MQEFPITPSLSISFQRYPYPPAGFLTTLPTSCGALPFVADTPRHLILPSPDGEAFWIGLIPAPDMRPAVVRVSALLSSGDQLDVVTGKNFARPQSTGSANIAVPPQYAVAGIARGDGTWWAFARDTGGTPAPICHSIELLTRASASAEPARRQADPRRQHDGAGRGGSPSPSPPPPKAGPADVTASVRVDLVEPGYFETLTSVRLPPLDTANRYGGWQLP